MKKLINIFAILTLALLSGCATGPTQAQFDAADYGELPSDYREQLKEIINAKLKDPYSSQFNFDAPYPAPWEGHLSGALIAGKKSLGFGWFVQFGVNAKNGYGAYNGFEEYAYFYTGGQWQPVTLY